MPDVTFGQEDINSALPLEPAGWFPGALRSVTEGPGKSDPSGTTYTCEFEIIDGPRKGTIIPHWFSSKMQANIIRFIRCYVQNIEAGKKYPLEGTVGKPVMIYGAYDVERNSNVIKDFKPVGK